MSTINEDYINQFLETAPEPILYEPIIRTKADKITVGGGSRIDGFVKLEGGHELTIGRYVHVASFCHLGIGGGRLIVEDFVAISSGAKIISGSNQIDALSISASAPPEIMRIAGSVTTLKRFSAVFSNGVVLPGVTLHEGAVLAAGSVATKDIPAWEIWAGIPAKFIKKRVIK